MPLTILLIDTDDDRAHALEEKLSESGFARVVRAQGPDLAATVEQTKPDLVIVDMGLTTPAQIGARLKAGTNCGSCIPELKKLLHSVPALNAAE